MFISGNFAKGLELLHGSFTSCDAVVIEDSDMSTNFPLDIVCI
jgi:hypothetical protein